MRDKDQILMEHIYLTEMVEVDLYTIITENQHLIAEGRISEYIKKISKYTKDLADKSKQGTDEAVRTVYLKLFDPIKSKLQQFSQTSPKSAKVLKLLTNPTNIRSALILVAIVSSVMGSTVNAGEFEQMIEGFDLGELGSDSSIDLETANGTEDIFDSSTVNNLLGKVFSQDTIDLKNQYMQETGKSPQDYSPSEFEEWLDNLRASENQAKYDANVAGIEQYKTDNPDWDADPTAKYDQWKLDNEAQDQAQDQAKYDANVADIEQYKIDNPDWDADPTAKYDQMRLDKEAEYDSNATLNQQNQLNKNLNRIIDLAKQSSGDPSKLEQVKNFAQQKGIDWSEIQPHIESTFRNRDKDQILMEYAYNQVQG